MRVAKPVLSPPQVFLHLLLVAESVLVGQRWQLVTHQVLVWGRARGCGEGMKHWVWGWQAHCAQHRRGSTEHRWGFGHPQGESCGRRWKMGKNNITASCTLLPATPCLPHTTNSCLGLLLYSWGSSTFSNHKHCNYSWSKWRVLTCLVSEV